ncbi:Pentapeptide repeat [anaerobic digester metagenome]
MKRYILILMSVVMMSGSCSAGNQEKISNGIPASEIIKSLNKGKPVLLKDKIITGDLDFTTIKKQGVFSSSMQIAGVDQPVTFLNCIFMGKVITNGMQSQRQVRVHFESNLTFEACDFRADADFDNITVDGMVNFTGAIFRERAMFNNATFNGRHNYFTAISAEKHFSMQESLVIGAMDFFKAKTRGKLSFQSTEFRGIARFHNLDCDGRSDFSLTRFRDDALFTYANFTGHFGFSDAVVYGRFDMNNVEFQSPATLTSTVFYGPVTFEKTSVKGKFDVSRSVFYSGKPAMQEFRTLEPGDFVSEGTKFASFNDLNKD